MIGKIKGTLIELEGNEGLIDTASGLSYNVFLTPAIVFQNPVGTPVEIYTYHQVREDAQILYGFESKKELHLFKLLLTVSGVGPKTAFNVVSHSKAEELIAAIKSNSVDYLTKTPGLGKKTAMKIILELSQKLKSDFQLEKMYLSEDDKTVVDALVALGYTSQDARKMLTKIPKDMSVEKRIQEALKVTSDGKKSV